VRVATGGVQLSGTVRRADSAGVVLRLARGERAVPAPALDALWEARGRATWLGARAGAAGGGAVGLALGWLAGGFGCAGNCAAARHEGRLVGLALGAAGGAAVGAAVGTLLPRWRPLYP
jgi:hypothetical protein